MKRRTKTGLALLIEAGVPLPFSPEGARDILDSDARQAAELRRLRKALNRLLHEGMTVGAHGEAKDALKPARRKP